MAWTCVSVAYYMWLLVLLVLAGCSRIGGGSQAAEGATAPLAKQPIFLVYEDTDTRLGDEFILDARDQQTVIDATIPSNEAQQQRNPLFVGNAKGLRIQDEDAGANNLLVIISCSRGRLSVQRSAPLYNAYSSMIIDGRWRAPVDNSGPLSTGISTKGFSSNGESADIIRLIGNVFEINSVLGSAVYQPPPNGYGYVSITVDVSLLGNDGANVTVMSRSNNTLTIKVIPKNDAPVIDLVNASRGTLYDNDVSSPVGIVYALEDTPYPIGRAFNVSDADMDGIMADGGVEGPSAAMYRMRRQGRVTATEGVPTSILSQYSAVRSHSSSQDLIYVSVQVLYGRLAVKGDIGGSVAFLANYSSHIAPPQSFRDEFFSSSFSANTWNGGFNNSIFVTAVIAGTITNGMQFHAIGSSGVELVTTVVGCSLSVEGTGTCVLNVPVALPAQTVVQASIMKNTVFANSKNPTAIPTLQPTAPTFPPFDERDSVPTGQPTRQPSRQPTGQPSRDPTRQPSTQPTGHPTKFNTQPTLQPTSRQPTLPTYTSLPTLQQTDFNDPYIATNTDPSIPGWLEGAVNPLLLEQRADFSDLSAAAAHFRNLSNADIIAFLGVVPRRSARLDYDVRFGGSRGLYFRGQYEEVLAVLRSLIYSPDPDWFGVDTLTIYVNDLGNVGVDGEKDTTRTILIDVAPVQDPPVINTPSLDLLVAVEDMVAIIGADCCRWAAADHPDNEPYRSTATASHNPIMPAEHNLDPSTATNASYLSFQLSDRDLHVSAQAAVRGKRRVLRRTNLSQGSMNVLTNDPEFYATYTSPQNTDLYNPAYAYVDPSDPAQALSDDSTAKIDKNLKFTLFLTCTHGTMTMLRPPETLVFLFGAGFQDDSIQVRGSLADVNAALKGLLFTPDANWNSQQQWAHGNPFRTGSSGIGDSLLIKTTARINMTVVDAAGLRAESGVNIYVKPSNDPPVLSMGHLTPHDSLNLDEHDQRSRQRLSAVGVGADGRKKPWPPLKCSENAPCPLMDLTCRDVDAIETVGGSVLFSFSAANGTFSLDPLRAAGGAGSDGIAIGTLFESGLGNSRATSGRSNSKNGYLSLSKSRGLSASSVSVSVPAAMIDTVLRGIVYTPAVDYFGSDKITVTVDDLGNTGYGVLCPPGLEALSLPCRMTDTVNIAVVIDSKPERVEILLPTGGQIVTIPPNLAREVGVGSTGSDDSVYGASTTPRVRTVGRGERGEILTGIEDQDLAIVGLQFVSHDQFSSPWLTTLGSPTKDQIRYKTYENTDASHLHRLYPGAAPSDSPTVQPTSQATFTLAPNYWAEFPTPEPTIAPTRPTPRPIGTFCPTGQPTRQPSRQPTGQPSRQPSGQPTGHPTWFNQGPPTSGYRGQNTNSPTINPTLATYTLGNRNTTYSQRPGLLGQGVQGIRAGLGPAQGGKLFRVEFSCDKGGLKLLNVPSGLKTGLSYIAMVQNIVLSVAKGLGGNYTLTLGTSKAPFITQTTSLLTSVGELTHATEVTTALQALSLTGGVVSVNMTRCDAAACTYSITFPALTREISLISIDDTSLTGSHPRRVSAEVAVFGRLSSEHNTAGPFTASSRLIYTGSIFDLNIAATSLVLTPQSNTNVINSGLVAITVSITNDIVAVTSVDGYSPTDTKSSSQTYTDNGDESRSSAARIVLATSTFYVRLAAKNDAPCISTAGDTPLVDPQGLRVKRATVVAVETVVLEEEEEHPLAAFVVTDVDDEDYPLAQMSLTVAAAHGIFRSDNPTTAAMMGAVGTDPAYANMLQSANVTTTSDYTASATKVSGVPDDAFARTGPGLWETYYQLFKNYIVTSNSGLALPWSFSRGALGVGLSLAPTIAHPIVAFKRAISNGTSSGSNIFQDSVFTAHFTAYTWAGALNNTIHITAVSTGDISNGMQFRALGVSETAEVTTMMACSIASGVGTCVVSVPVALPGMTTLQASMTRSTVLPSVVGTAAVSELPQAPGSGFGTGLGSVYVSGQNNATLYAFDLHTGSLRWTFSRRSPSAARTLYSSPALAINVTRVTRDGESVPLSTSLSADDVSVLTISSDGMVFSISAQDGTKEWSFALPGPPTASFSLSAPRTRGSVVYVSHPGSATVVALALAHNCWSPSAGTGIEPGDLLWQFTSPAGSTAFVKSTPAVHEAIDGSLGPINANLADILYIADDTGTVYALNMTQASAATSTAPTVWWSLPIGSPVTTALTVHPYGSALFTGCRDGFIRALSTDGSASILWSFKTGAALSVSPGLAVGIDGTVYVTSFDSYLYAINGSSGSLRWSFQAAGGDQVFGATHIGGGSSLSASSPVVMADGTVYVGSNDGYIYAVGMNGAVRWRVQTQGAVQASPAVSSDGTVYISSKDGYFYSLANTLGSPCAYTADCNMWAGSTPFGREGETGKSDSELTESLAYICSPVSHTCVCHTSSHHTQDVSGRFCVVAPSDDARRTAATKPSSSPSAQKVVLDNLYGPVAADPAYRVVRLHGTLSEINEALLFMSYVPDMDYVGPDSILVKVCDECFAEGYFFPEVTSIGEDASAAAAAAGAAAPLEKDCSLCQSRLSPIAITGVNDPPLWHVPAVGSEVSCYENSALTFTGPTGSIQIYDSDSGDSGELYVRVRVTRGTLSIDTLPANVSLLMGTGDDDQEIRMQGTLISLNLALEGLTYRPPANWNSIKSGYPDDISLYVDDLGNTGDIGANNSTTAVRKTSATATLDDGSIGQAALMSGDRDMGSMRSSRLGLSAKASITIVVLEGINQMPYIGLPGAVYRYFPCDSTESQRTEATDRNKIPKDYQCQTVTSVDTFYVQEDTATVIAADTQHNKTIILTQSATANEASGVDAGSSESVPFGEKLGVDNWLQVYDVDGQDNRYRAAQYLLTLGSIHGVLVLPDCARLGLRVVSGQYPASLSARDYSTNSEPFGSPSLAANTKTRPWLDPESFLAARSAAYRTAVASDVGGSLSVMGDLTAVNEALRGLLYLPARNYFGSDAISIYVNDRALTPSSGLTCNETLPLFVQQVVDAPRLVIPTELRAVTVLEDTRIALRGLQVEDPEYLEFVTGVPTFASASAATAKLSEGLAFHSTRGSASSSGTNRVGVGGRGITFSPRLLFAFNVSGNVTAHMVHQPTGYLLMVDNNGTAMAVSPEGSVVWRRWFGAGRLKLSVPVMTNNPMYKSIRVYISNVGYTSDASKIYAIDVMTGSSIWTAKPDGPNAASNEYLGLPPIINDGYLYVITSYNRLYCVSEGNGIKRWHFIISDYVSRPPVLIPFAVNMSTLYLVTDGYKLLNIDSSVSLSVTSRLKWSKSIAATNGVKANVAASSAFTGLKTTGALAPVVSRDTTFVYTAISYAVSYNISQRSEVAGSNYGSAKHVVTTEYRSLVSAHSAEDGTLLWQLDLPSAPRSCLLVDAANTLFVFTADDVLYAIGSKSAILWTRQLSQAPSQYAALDESKGLLIFGASGGGGVGEKYIYALGANDGALIWRYPIGPASLASGVTLATGSRNEHRVVFSTTNPLHSVVVLANEPVSMTGTPYGSPGGISAVALGIRDPRQSWRYLVYAINNTRSIQAEALASMASFGQPGFRLTTAVALSDSSYPVAAAGAAGSVAVFAELKNGTLIALDTTDSGPSVLWKLQPWGYSEQLTAPATMGSTVYVGCSDGNLYALSLATGSVLWTVLTIDGTMSVTAPIAVQPASIDPTAAAPADKVFVTSMSAVQAVSSGGQLLWTYSPNPSSNITVSPIVLPQSFTYNTSATSIQRQIGFPVVVVCGIDDVAAITAETGMLVWQISQLRGPAAVASPITGITTSPLLDSLYFTLQNGTVGSIGWTTDAVHSWNLREWVPPSSVDWSARVLWSTVVGLEIQGVGSAGQVSSAPAASASGTVFVGSLDTNLYALSGTTGDVLWRFTTGGAVTVQPVVTADGTVYVCSNDGFLYAINDDGGELRWRLKTQGPLQVPLSVASDGTLYATSQDGYLYSITNALNSPCKFTADCNLAYGKPIDTDLGPAYTCQAGTCACASGFTPDASSRECWRLGRRPDPQSPYRASPPYSEYVAGPNTEMPLEAGPAGSTTDFQSELYAYSAQRNRWNVTMTRLQQSSLLRVHIHATHGRLKLSSATGLRFYRVPNATEESSPWDLSPVTMRISEKMMFSMGAMGLDRRDFVDDPAKKTDSSAANDDDDGVSGDGGDALFWESGDESGDPLQMWWRSTLIEGRLGDINRALDVLTYAPDLNWHSELPSLTRGPGAGLSTELQWASQGQVDEVTVRVSNPHHHLPVATAVIRVTVKPANDAPVVRVPNAIVSSSVLTDDGLAPLITDSLTVYTTENRAVGIGGSTVFDVDLQLVLPYEAQGSTHGGVPVQPQAQGFLRVVVESSHGLVSLSDDNPEVLLNSVSDVSSSVGIRIETSTSGSSKLSDYISFTGPVDALNMALSGLVFTPAQYYFGIHAQVKITVGDLGNTGWGGERFDSQVIRIIVLPINNLPLIATPGDFSAAANIQVIDGGSFLRLQGAKYMPWATSQGGAVGSQKGLLQQSTIATPSGGDKYIPLTPWQSGYELWCLLETKTESPISTENDVLSFAHQKAGAGSFQWDNRQVADIHLGSFSSHPRFMTLYKNRLYFQADNGVTEPELWRAEGQYGIYYNASFNAGPRDKRANWAPPTTPDRESSALPDDLTPGMQAMGIAQFLDQVPGADGAEPSDLEVHGEYLFFSSAGIDLSWMVAANYRDECNSFRQSSHDSRVFFAVSGSNEWVPGRTYDCPLGYHWASTEEAHNYFLASPSDHNYRYRNPMTTDNRMWHSDASPYVDGRDRQGHGPQAYNQRNIDPSKTLFEQSASVERFHEDKVYYDACGWDGYTWGGVERRYFRFRDSAETFEYKHAGKPASYRPDTDPNNVLETAFFAGIVCVLGAEEKPSPQDAFRSAANVFPYLARGGPPGWPEYNSASSPQFPTPLRRNLGGGKELWRTDGTVHGTTRIDDIERGPLGSAPSDLKSFKDYLYFAAYTETHGKELWRTTGQDFATAKQVSVIGSGDTGAESGGIMPGPQGSDPRLLTVAENFLFFAATDSYHGRELWAVQYLTGSPSPAYDVYTLLLFDTVQGTASGAPLELCSCGGALPLYFTVSSPLIGRELWRSDGTTLGTVPVADINTGDPDSTPRYLVWFRGVLLFQADNGIHGAELWKHDPSGSSPTTTMISDIRSGTASSFPSFFTPYSSLLDGESYLVFSATDGYGVGDPQAPEGVGGCQLWRTDGTLQGTFRIFQKTSNDFYMDRSSLDAAHPARMMVYNNGLYLSANYGLQTINVPKGGISVGSNDAGNNDEALQGIDQAVVVSDIDTPPDGKVTVTLNVDKGLLIINPPNNLDVEGGLISGLSSSSASASTTLPRFKFLVAEARATDREFISRNLQQRGHMVDFATTAEEAFSLIVGKFIGSHFASDDEARRYDGLFLSIDFNPVEQEPRFTRPSSTGDFVWAAGSGLQDGIEMLRLIRRWEAEMAALAAPNADIVKAANDAAVAVALQQGITYSSTLQAVLAGLGLEQLVSAGAVEIASYNGSDFSWAGYKALKIVSMSKLHRMEGGEREAYLAGADLFLYEPDVDYMSLAEQAGVVGPLVGMTTTTAASIMLAEEKRRYSLFVDSALNVMHKQSNALRVVSQLGPGVLPAASTLMTLPGVSAGRSYLGSTLTLTGTIQDVNAMFRDLFYYAPFGISGTVGLTVTVTDQPKTCHSLISGDTSGIHYAHGIGLGDMLTLSGPSNFFQVPALSVMPTASIYGASLSDSRADSVPAVGINGLPIANSQPSGRSQGTTRTWGSRNVSFCDAGTSNVVTTVLPLLVVAVNAPPLITIANNQKALTALRGYNVFTALPQMTVSDSGHDQKAILDSFGYLTSAPVTVTVYAKQGRLSWTSKDDVVFLVGTGLYDRRTEIRGGLLAVNKLLGGLAGIGGKDDGTGLGRSRLVYSCLAADGCKYGDVDLITVIVNDEGFYGRGGPLSFEVSMSVNIV